MRVSLLALLLAACSTPSEARATTSLEYIQVHPWWTLVYLLVVCAAVGSLFRVRVGK